MTWHVTWSDTRKTSQWKELLFLTGIWARGSCPAGTSGSKLFRFDIWVFWDFLMFQNSTCFWSRVWLFLPIICYTFESNGSSLSNRYLIVALYARSSTITFISWNYSIRIQLRVFYCFYTCVQTPSISQLAPYEISMFVKKVMVT